MGCGAYPRSLTKDNPMFAVRSRAPKTRIPSPDERAWLKRGFRPSTMDVTADYHPVQKRKTIMFYVSPKPSLTPVFLIAVAVICLEFVREYSIVGAFNPIVWALVFIAFGFWFILRALRIG
jgi:hypothetical protein